MPLCTFCNSLNTKPFQVKEVMFNTGETYDYQECLNCGSLSLQTQITDYSTIYPSNYYSFSPINELSMKSFTKRIKFGTSKFLLRHNINFWKTIIGSIFKSYFYINHLELYPTQRILDVGCGGGFLTYLLKNIGFNDAIGIDPFIPGDIFYQNNSSILKKSIFEIEGKWDVILFNHSFEHIPNPHEVLHKCNELLQKGGCCAFAIPVSGSLAWKKYGTHWFQLDAPRHLFLHSTKSIQHLADKCGFKVSKVIYNSRYHQFTKSRSIKKGFSLSNPPKLSPAEKVLAEIQKVYFKMLNIYANMRKIGDQAVFVLTKKEGMD